MSKKSKTLEELSKKQLIKIIEEIRPHATAYEGVCQNLGINGNILGYIGDLKKKLKATQNHLKQSREIQKIIVKSYK